jgi:hypothetical protein
VSIFDSDPGNSPQLGPSSIFSHSGFRVGILGGLVMVVVHLFLLVIFDGTTQGDTFAWTFQIFLYFILGRSAAKQEYRKQASQTGDSQSVKSAGLGAALVTSVIIWFYIIVRGIVRDALGVFIVSNPFGLFCMIIIDVLIALGLGSLAGRSIAKKHQKY